MRKVGKQQESLGSLHLQATMDTISTASHSALGKGAQLHQLGLCPCLHSTNKAAAYSVTSKPDKMKTFTWVFKRVYAQNVLLGTLLMYMVIASMVLWLQGGAWRHCLGPPAQAWSSLAQGLQVLFASSHFILTQFLTNPNSLRALSRGYINNGCFYDSSHHLCCPIIISAQRLSAASLGPQEPLALLCFILTLACI